MGGRIYDLRYKEEQESKYEAVIGRIDISPSEIVLDNGCGTGLLFNKINAHIVGLDFSNKLLISSRKRSCKNDMIHLVQADADNLPFRSAIFHKVFSITLIQNIKNPLKTILEMKRACHYHGVLIITALKKSFSIKCFKRILEKSELKEIDVFSNDEFKDHMSLSKTY